LSLSPVRVDQFGGLNLDADPGDVGWTGAIDLLDVEFDRPGLLRTRDYFSTLVANSGLTGPLVVGVGKLGYLVCTSAAVNLYNDSGLVGSAVAPNQYYNGTAQPFGTSSANYVYLSDAGGANAIRRLTTAGVISAPAGMPTPLYLSRTPTDNRLVAIGTGGGSPHRVQFSNAGDAETWGANDYIDLDPGDSEYLTGGAVHGNSLYIFKQSKVFEFYGTATDSSGNPIFSNRAIRGIAGAEMCPVAAPDGVYFYGYGGGSDRPSVFRVNSGGIVDVGKPISLALASLAPSTFTIGALSRVDTIGGLTFASGSVRLLLANGGSRYVFSYGIDSGQWTIMQLTDAVFGITGYGTNNKSFIFGAGAPNAPIYKRDPTNTSSDAARTPTPRYRSGFSDLGSPDMKRIHSWRVNGSGTPTLKLSTDFGSLETGAAMTLGTSPAVAEAVRRYAPRGRRLSWQLSGTSAWSVNSLTAYVAGKRKSGEHTT